MIHGLLKEAPDAGRAAPVLACIVDAVSGGDRSMLDELERLIREKRAALQPEVQGGMSPRLARQPTGSRTGTTNPAKGPAQEGS